MRKCTHWLAAGLIFLASCSRSAQNEALEPSDENTVEAPAKRGCQTMEVLEAQLAADPGMRARMDQIEKLTKQAIENGETNRLLAGGVIEIPVVVNVLYRTAAENVSTAQIQSQIDVLNKDFAATNTDVNNTPALFQPVLAGNTNIRFVLTNVVRKATKKRSWGTNDAMKLSSQGGIDATDPATTLNIWVCTLSNSILGYAQFPGGPLATDGVVILNTGFGTTGTAAAPFNLGRTATHEVGHWLNLRHIWGDATCGNDQVGDTPQHNTANYGCPAYPHLSTCTGTPVEMTMNYMDYTNDACMYMFSAGQKSRMAATFVAGGPRNSFAQP
jgi:hypothetical protein